MVRDCLVRPRWLSVVLVAWGVLVAALPSVGNAAPLPPSRDGTEPTDLDALVRLLEQKVIRTRLGELGLSAAEAEEVLRRLSPDERSELAARVEELDAGGNAAAALAIAIIVGLVVILTLELLGRRVLSRP
jgi:Family of unknown function (DUF6627)